MEKLSGKGAEVTQEEWRELGFFYTIDEKSKRWDLYGDSNGLAKFSEEISKFLSKEEVFGNHEHLLPHWYLTLEYDEVADISKRGVLGRKFHFQRFRYYLLDLADSAKPKDILELDKCFSKTSFNMFFHVKGEGFDPSSMDWQLQR